MDCMLNLPIPAQKWIWAHKTFKHEFRFQTLFFLNFQGKFGIKLMFSEKATKFEKISHCFFLSFWLTWWRRYHWGSSWNSPGGIWRIRGVIIKVTRHWIWATSSFHRKLKVFYYFFTFVLIYGKKWKLFNSVDLYSKSRNLSPVSDKAGRFVLFFCFSLSVTDYLWHFKSFKSWDFLISNSRHLRF